MGKIDIQCINIGEDSQLYSELGELLNEFDLRVNTNQTLPYKKDVVRSLKKVKNSGLIFISDTVPFSLQLLSDLVWQHCPDALVVILTKKTPSISFKKTLNSSYISRLNFDKESKSSRLFLGHLIQIAELRKKFRRCKRLLGISEKRCQWLVDSSKEAVAYISRDLHLYANHAYLSLFGVTSLRNLHSIPVSDFIENEEHVLFEKFVKGQLKQHSLYRSLVLTMRKKNGKLMRSTVIAIPSVFKGKRCIQLWVHSISQGENSEDKMSTKNESSLTSIRHPKAELESFKPFQKSKKNLVSSSKILKEIINRKEAAVTADKLISMKTNYKGRFANHYMLSLKVAAAQRQGIDDLLFSVKVNRAQRKREIFWDQVILARLLQILIKQDVTNKKLLITLSESSLNNNFIKWLEPGLQRLGNKVENLVFLIPAQLDVVNRKEAIHVIEVLRSYQCKIALDNFSASVDSLKTLKHIHPNYIRLSLPWVRLIEGRNTREIALGSFIRQFEEANIKVIAPCSFSAEMQRLFALSGVSFCQETSI